MNRIDPKNTMVNKGVAVLSHVAADPRLVEALFSIEKVSSELDLFVRACLDSADEDDEILNWCFVACEDNLRAACWNMAGGFHPTAMACLRAALEIGVVALHFQLVDSGRERALEQKTGTRNENGEPVKQRVTYETWDRGLADTPYWKTMWRKLDQRAELVDLRRAGIKLVEEIRSSYGHLCNYTHSKPWSDGEPASNTWLGLDPPCTDHEVLERSVHTARHIISLVAAIWLASYPSVLETDDIGGWGLSIKDLFHSPVSMTVLNHFTG